LKSAPKELVAFRCASACFAAMQAVGPPPPLGSGPNGCLLLHGTGGAVPRGDQPAAPHRTRKVVVVCWKTPGKSHQGLPLPWDRGASSLPPPPSGSHPSPPPQPPTPPVLTHGGHANGLSPARPGAAAPRGDQAATLGRGVPERCCGVLENSKQKQPAGCQGSGPRLPQPPSLTPPPPPPGPSPIHQHSAGRQAAVQAAEAPVCGRQRRKECVPGSTYLSNSGGKPPDRHNPSRTPLLPPSNTMRHPDAAEPAGSSPILQPVLPHALPLFVKHGADGRPQWPPRAGAPASVSAALTGGSTLPPLREPGPCWAPTALSLAVAGCPGAEQAACSALMEMAKPSRMCGGFLGRRVAFAAGAAPTTLPWVRTCVCLTLRARPPLPGRWPLLAASSLALRDGASMACVCVCVCVCVCGGCRVVATTAWTAVRAFPCLGWTP
jgi:hypothetical protein